MNAPVEPADIEQPVLVAPRGLVPVVLAVMTTIGVTAVLAPAQLQPSVRPSLRLDSWRPSDARLDAIQARRSKLAADATAAESSPPSARSSAQKLLGDGLALFLAAEKRLGYQGLREDPAARRQLAELEERLRLFGLQYGTEGVRSWAVMTAQRVAVMARTATQDLVVARTTLAQADQGASTRPAIAGLEAAMPGLLRTLSRIGLERHVGAHGLDPAAQLVIEALIEQRIYELTRRLPGPRPELDSELLRTLTAFRVEAHQGLPLARKLALLDELSELDATYPTTFVSATLLARAGRLRAAQTRFLLAAKAGQSPGQARANAHWCRDRLRQQRDSDDTVAPGRAQAP